jgi:hypothetical protein
MLGTPTRRERVPLFPRFHIVAGSRERLPVRHARSVVVAMDMGHRAAVVLVDEQPAVSTATLWRLEPLGPSWLDTRGAAVATTPVHPLAIIRTAAAVDVAMPGNRPCTVSVKRTGGRLRGRGGKDQTAVQSAPRPLQDPGGAPAGVASMCPAAALVPEETSEPADRGLPHTGAGIVGPPAHLRVALREQGALGQGCPAPDAPAQRRERRRLVGLGGCAEGFASRALAGRACARSVFPDPLLPAVQPQEGTAGRLALPGGTDAPLGGVPRAPAVRQPGHPQRLAVLQDGVVLMAHHRLLGRGADAGARGAAGDRLVPPLPGAQGPPGRPWSRNSAHLHGSHHAGFTLPLPKRSVRVSSHFAFQHCRRRWSPNVGGCTGQGRQRSAALSMVSFPP